MARFFREPDRRQRYLLPVDMMDWLPEGDIVHLIVDAVALMDLSGFEATCKVGKAGQAPFSPRVLLVLLIYAYSHGIRSSRAIERLCGRDVGYRFIVGAAVPDHSVIARFRQRHVERMKAVFLAVLVRRDLRFLGTFVVGLVIIMLVAASVAFWTPVGTRTPAFWRKAGSEASRSSVFRSSFSSVLARMGRISSARRPSGTVKRYTFTWPETSFSTVWAGVRVPSKKYSPALSFGPAFSRRM